MKNFILILFGFVLLGCENQTASVNLSSQITFVKTRIITLNEDLKTKVEETGYSPAGKEFLMISEQSSNLTQELINKIENGEDISKREISKLIEFSHNRYDTIPIDSSFIVQALSEFNRSGSEDALKMSLLLFNADFVDNVIKKFNGYFQSVDYLKPIPVGEKFKIRKGKTFSGRVVSQAKMVAIKYLYEIDDPQTDEGFIELPSNVNSDYDGIISIKGKEVGLHKIKLRSTHWQNGEEVTFENEFELKVTE